MNEGISLAKRFFKEVWSPPNNLDAINDLMTEDYIIVTAGKTIEGREKFKEWVAHFQERLLEPENEHLDLFTNEDGSKVVSRWICKGLNNGIMDSDPDRRKVSFTGIAIWEVREGRLAKCWVERAAFELYQNLANP